MKLKSGVYFVHYDDIPTFVETAKAQGRRFAGRYHLRRKTPTSRKA